MNCPRCGGAARREAAADIGGCRYKAAAPLSRRAIYIYVFIFSLSLLYSNDGAVVGRTVVLGAPLLFLLLCQSTSSPEGTAERPPRPEILAACKAVSEADHDAA